MKVSSAISRNAGIREVVVARRDIDAIQVRQMRSIDANVGIPQVESGIAYSSYCISGDWVRWINDDEDSCGV